MEGFILAAGLGTRLRPLTDDRPKALVEVNGVTLLELTIRRLEEAGIEHIVVNVHHFADKVIEKITELQSDQVTQSPSNPATQQPSHPTTIAISDERTLLLDTGGGLKHAAPLFSGRENILVHNVDILSDIDLHDLERHHKEQGNLVTLCVSRRDTKRLLAFDDDGLLLGRADTSHLSPFTSHLSPSTSHLAFSGISVVSPELFALLPEADHPYPVIDEYIRLAAASHRIGAYLHPADRWLDVGKPETLKQAQSWIRS